MKAVTQLVDELIAREGGYSNHPSDKGGATNFGITEHIARAHGYLNDMKDLPRATAEAIYLEQYWLGPKFNMIQPTMPRLAIELFDTGVNMGPQKASKFLQRCLNVLNQRTKIYPDLLVDGQLGRMTFFALDHLRQQRGVKQAELVLLRCVDSLQAARYIELAEINPSQEDFVWGWILNRVGVEGELNG